MLKSCEFDGAQFEAVSDRARFCSDRCRKAAERARTAGQPLPGDSPPLEVEPGPLEVATRVTLDTYTDPGALGVAALDLARRIDQGRSATSAIAALHRQWLATMGELADRTPRREPDAVELLQARRADRLARQAAHRDTNGEVSP